MKIDYQNETINFMLNELRWERTIVAKRPDTDNFDYEDKTHYKVHQHIMLVNPHNNAVFSTYYSFGAKKGKHGNPVYDKPRMDKLDFLQCLVLDCSCYFENEEEYFAEFGWPTNEKEYRDGRRILVACKATRAGMLKLLGKELYEQFIALTDEDFEQASAAKLGRIAGLSALVVDVIKGS